MSLKKLFTVGAVIGGMIGGNLSCGGNPIEAQTQGPPGPQGPAGVSGYEVASEKSLFIPPGVALSLSVTCPTTKVAISGGWSSQGTGLGVANNHPDFVNRNKWDFTIGNPSAAGITVDLYAVCAFAS